MHKEALGAPEELSDDHRRWQPAAGVLACEYDGGTALLSFATGRYFTLNDTASALWARLAAALTVDEAARDLASEYEISFEIAQRDASELLRTLSTLSLIAPRVNRHADAHSSASMRPRPLPSGNVLAVPSFLQIWLTLVKFHTLPAGKNSVHRRLDCRQWRA